VDATFVLDGVHIPFIAQKGKKALYTSYKTRKSAVNYQMMATQDSLVRYIDKGQPGSHHDMFSIRHCAAELKVKTNWNDDYDRVLVDGGYRGIEQHGLDGIMPYRNSRQHLLGVDERKWNHHQAAERSKVERLFGRIKNKYSILSKPFNGTRRRHREIVMICVALYNEEERISRNLAHNL